MDDPLSVVIVRGLQNRLVLTLPQDRHDLRSTRFYILIQGAGSLGSEVTFGSLFFRFSRSRIIHSGLTRARVQHLSNGP